MVLIQLPPPRLSAEATRDRASHACRVFECHVVEHAKGAKMAEIHATEPMQ
jgi:hypothetical protein